MTEFQKTPRLDALLKRLSATLRRNVWLFGLGTALFGAATWLVFMYASDRLLKLPAPIRIIHFAILLGGTGYLLYRTLFKHTGSLPGRDGLAMLAQRALPTDLPQDDRFVSALQLRDSVSPTSASAPLVGRVIAAAEDAAPRADLGRVTDAKAPRQRVAMGAVASLVAVGALATEPAMARIFAARMLGGDVSWPRKTNLSLEVPSGTATLSIDKSTPGVIRVRAARGTDVPLLVKAAGLVPDFVTVRFEESGAAVEVGQSGPDSFSTVLPSIQQNTTLSVVGGDDDRGVPKVEIEVLQPPDIARLAFAVVPPAYSGLPSRVVQNDASVRILEGSRVAVHVVTDPAEASGMARSFPTDEVIELVSGVFPGGGTGGTGSMKGTDTTKSTKSTNTTDTTKSTNTTADESAVVSLFFERTISEPLRFRFELRDSTGLTNPDPALFGIESYPDRAPELLTLSPARVELPVVLGSAIPLRLIARDDFGVASVRLRVLNVANDELQRTFALDTREIATASSTGRAVFAVTATRLVEVESLAADGALPLAEGSMLQLVPVASDARQPEANETIANPIGLRVVSADEFLRRQRDGLRLAAEDVVAIKDRIERSEIEFDIFKSAMSGDNAEMPEPARLSAALGDARRAEGDLAALARDLSTIASEMIYSRIDDRSGALEARLFELSDADDAIRGGSSETWRTVATELAEGKLGSPGRAGALVRVVGMATSAASDGSRVVIEELESARAAGGVEDARRAIFAASENLLALREEVQRLAAELGEWDSMQSIVARTRDILRSSKNLEARMKKQAEDKK